MESFCAAGRIKAFAHRVGSPSVLERCTSILEQFIDSDVRGTLQSDIRRFFPVTSVRPSSNPQVLLLDLDIREALQLAKTRLMQELSGWTPSDYATLHGRYENNGFIFSTSHSHPRNSVVFFQSSSGVIQPGLIRAIFTMYSRDGSSQWTFFAIHPYLPSLDTYLIFAPFIDFGVSLWSTEYAPRVEIVPIATRTINHAVRRKWCDGIQVLKSLSRVSVFAFALLAH